jgi:hypothetical protein
MNSTDKIMNKDRSIVLGVVAFLVVGSLLDAGLTDGVFIAAAIGFFALCIAYTEWCGRL